jgi:hypothetical protein
LLSGKRPSVFLRVGDLKKEKNVLTLYPAHANVRRVCFLAARTVIAREDPKIIGGQKWVNKAATACGLIGRYQPRPVYFGLRYGIRTLQDLLTLQLLLLARALRRSAVVWWLLLAANKIELTSK